MIRSMRARLAALEAKARVPSAAQREYECERVGVLKQLTPSERERFIALERMPRPNAAEQNELQQFFDVSRRRWDELWDAAIVELRKIVTENGNDPDAFFVQLNDDHAAMK